MTTTAQGRSLLGIRPNGLEQIGRAHHVHVQRLARLLVCEPDDRLCGEVEDDIRLGLGKRITQAGRIPDIRLDVGDALAHAGDIEQGRLGRGRKGVAGDLGPERTKPQRQPRPLETGVPRHEDTPAGVSAAKQMLHVCHLSAPAVRTRPACASRGRRRQDPPPVRETAPRAS